MHKIFHKINNILRSNKIFKRVFEKSEMSKTDAIKIQQDTYGSRKSCKRNNFDKPYLSIIEFLDSPDYEVFCAAVSSLSNIAKNSVKNSKQIKDILQKKLEDKSLKEEQKKYLAEHLSEI